MLQFSPTVTIFDFNDELALILKEASAFSLVMQIGVDVNSIDDGKHHPVSLHGLSRAIDLDTHGDHPADTEALFQWMRKRMPRGYDVIFEVDHVHVECDPCRAESRIPQPAKPV